MAQYSLTVQSHSLKQLPFQLLSRYKMFSFVFLLQLYSLCSHVLVCVVAIDVAVVVAAAVVIDIAATAVIVVVAAVVVFVLYLLYPHI